MRQIFFLFLVSVALQSCGGSDNKNVSSSVESSKVNVTEVVETPIFDVIKKSDLYSEPNEKSNKLINQKATKALGEIYYLSIDKSCKVKVLEEHDAWSKIQVVTPDWLRDTHIGWVKNEILRHPKDNVTDVGSYEENKDYQILYSNKMGNATNFHILLLWKKFDENSLEKLANFIKSKESVNDNCNIHIYDSKDIVPLIERYPLKGQDYIKLAEHYVYLFSFDGMSMYYPFIDVLYKEYGGKKQIDRE